MIFIKVREYLIKAADYINMLMHNKRMFGTTIAILAILLLLDVNGVNKSKIAIKANKVVKGDIVATVSAPGLVKATTAQLGVKAPGVVAWIGVNEGDKVEKGQLLLKLDSYENALKEYTRIQGLNKKGFATSQQLENAKYVLDGSSIRSPIDGIVSNVAVDVGETASPGYTIITVLRPKGLSIEIQVDQVDIGGVKRGEEVRVLSDAYPDDVFEGKITFLNNEAEFKSIGRVGSADEDDKIFRGKVELLNETAKLYSGMTVDTEIVIDRVSGAISVPRDAVLSDMGKYYVYVVNFGRVHKTPIKISLKDALNVGVIEGVKEGDLVASSNILKLKDHSRVKIERK